MSKEIIINGVDVSECIHYGYRGKAGYWCHYYDEPCTDYPNCHYKQIRRTIKQKQIDCGFGCAIAIFILIVGFLLCWQFIYAASNNAPQCAFARDVITCIEIARTNK